jgi:PTH1 family peptidyl-tRNA hydrolase
LFDRRGVMTRPGSNNSAVGGRALIVGLGNPGPRYAGNRHNVGFAVVDLLADRIGGRFKAHRGRCDVVEGRLAGRPVVLAKPKAYMNESGGPIVAISRFFKIPVTGLTIVHDELDLAFGVLRLKRGGGDGGHNGLRSATAALGTREYLRVRFGIGRPPGRQDPADFVLRDFTAAERKELPYLVDRAADAVETLLAEGLDAAQNAYND